MFKSKNGLFYFDKAQNNTQIISKIDGLSENIVSTLQYDHNSKGLLIAYQNATIDWLQNGEIFSNTAIKDLEIAGNKQIYQIYFYQNRAYLCTDFGVVVWDITRKLILDTYKNLGVGGANIPIYSASVSNDSLFLGTSQGVIAGSLASNLLDFNQWKRFNLTNNIPTQSIKKVVTLQNKVYAIFQSSSNNLYKYSHQNQWQIINTTQNINNLTQKGDYITLTYLQGALQAKADEIFTNFTDILIKNAQEAWSDENGNIYIADAQNGLITNKNGIIEKYCPTSPFSAESSHINFGNNQMLITSGGFQNGIANNNLNLGYDAFQNGIWQNFNAIITNDVINIPAIKDLNALAYNSLEKQWFFASFGQGILVKTNNNTHQIINANTPNTSLRNDLNNEVKITGVAVEKNGDTWFLQYNPAIGSPYLHVKRKSTNNWQGFTSTQTITQNLVDIFVDSFGLKWMRSASSGLWVFDDKTNRSRLLTTTNGKLPDNLVSAIMQDKEGQIWIGTNKGVAVLFNPLRVFEGNTNFFTPIFDSRPLLRSETITSMITDAGNRKWIGTQNGIWLFNAEANQLLKYFNSNNSPLSENQIKAIKMQETTGELFILTNKDLISYQTNSSQATENFENVKIFPNPVRPEFQGEVGISGLAQNAYVKITDVSGRLFFETKANGGTASWNLKDYNNIQAQTGIYLVFATKTDGSETLVGKIAVIK
jgi:ligand-binding sensor domain-containing protein